MTSYDIYVFILCFIVFVLLTSLAIVCLRVILKQAIRIIDNGLDDEKILEEHRKEQKNAKRKKYTKIIDYAVSGVVCLVFVILLIGSLAIRCSEDNRCDKLPQYRVVYTESMAYKHADNKYLEENNLNDQIQQFDLVKTEKLPDEMELELYDIVVYEVDDIKLIHRIVEIEEPNEFHPDCRHFKLQGDAVEAPDRFPVLYEQMQALYTGERTPFIGSFILFMQSPAGWLCVLLIIGAMIATPILERKLQNAKDRRLQLYVEGTEND